MESTIKHQVHLLLDPRVGGTKWDKLVNGFIVVLIILNTLAVVTETVDSLYEAHKQFFYITELISVIIFSIEYILRVWSCTEDPRFAGGIKGRITFMLTPGPLIDLVAILPFYLPLVMAFDLRFLRMFRLVRFLRFFKLGRYMNASRIIIKVFRDKKEELVLGFVLTIFLIVVSASFMYFIEHDAQPEKFSSIPETMWWSVATLTTAGYGDMYPVTVTGRILASFISILGIGLFALPAGILASGFSAEFKHTRHKQHCPNCGHEIE